MKKEKSISDIIEMKKKLERNIEQLIGIFENSSRRFIKDGSKTTIVKSISLDINRTNTIIMHKKVKVIANVDIEDSIKKSTLLII